MKTTALIIVATLLYMMPVSATGKRHVNPVPEKPSLQVTFLGVDGDFLLFSVKTGIVSPNTPFAIRNEAGDDLYRSWQTELNSLRRIRIPRSVRTVQFILGKKKDQCTRTFTVDTNIVETVHVTETGR